MEELTRSCKYCTKAYTKPYNCSVREWTEKRKYCSTSCGNKGKATPWLVKHHIKPGQTLSRNTQFKKGDTANEKNVQWKGANASYAAKHIWAKNHFGKPQLCELCGTTEKRMYHWANISREYKRDRSDWLRLCVPCHKQLDLTKPRGNQ